MTTIAQSIVIFLIDYGTRVSHSKTNIHEAKNSMECTGENTAMVLRVANVSIKFLG